MQELGTYIDRVRLLVSSIAYSSVLFACILQQSGHIRFKIKTTETEVSRVWLVRGCIIDEACIYVWHADLEVGQDALSLWTLSTIHSFGLDFHGNSFIHGNHGKYLRRAFKYTLYSRYVVYFIPTRFWFHKQLNQGFNLLEIYGPFVLCTLYIRIVSWWSAR